MNKVGLIIALLVLCAIVMCLCNPPRTEGFYWAQWGNVPMERENYKGGAPERFSPDEPGACARKRSVAARLEAKALDVVNGVR